MFFISSVIFFHSDVAGTKMWRYTHHQQSLDIWPQEMKKIKYGTKRTIDRWYQVCLTGAQIFGKKDEVHVKVRRCVFFIGHPFGFWWKWIGLTADVGVKPVGRTPAEWMVLPFWRRQRRRSVPDSRWWTSCWPLALCCCYLRLFLEKKKKRKKHNTLLNLWRIESERLIMFEMHWAWQHMSFNVSCGKKCWLVNVKWLPVYTTGVFLFDSNAASSSWSTFSKQKSD